MADSANTFQSLLPIFKQSYADAAMKTHKRPGNEPKFSNLKKKLKKK